MSTKPIASPAIFPHRAFLCALGIMLSFALLVLMPGSAAPFLAPVSESVSDAATTSVVYTPAGDWAWPVRVPRQVTDPFRAPAHDYGPGHRGMDIGAPVGAEVYSPAAGVVAFRGVVVDRPLLTIDHGDGIVTTFEPLQSELSPGDAVARGQLLGTVDRGGTTMAGSLHVGVRVNDEYVNPLPFFGDILRAVLLPVP